MQKPQHPPLFGQLEAVPPVFENQEKSQPIKHVFPFRRKLYAKEASCFLSDSDVVFFYFPSFVSYSKLQQYVGKNVQKTSHKEILNVYTCCEYCEISIHTTLGDETGERAKNISQQRKNFQIMTGKQHFFHERKLNIY